jgi:hypothetical protein
MALEFPEGFPFNRKPAEPAVEPAAAEAPVDAPATEPVTATAAIAAADVIAQSVAQSVVQAVVQAVAAQPPAAQPAAVTPAATEPAAISEPVAGTVAAAREAALARTEGGPPPGMAERRRVPRQTLVAKTTVRSESQLAVVAAGFVSNISMMGVGFHTRRPLAVGEKYQIRLEVGPMKWASRLRIISCRPNGDAYDIGAEFVGNELATLSRRELAA